MTEIVDFPVKPEARDYLARFARDAGEPGWLAARRQQAMTRFAELGFPSRRSESWRYLDLQPLEQNAAAAGARRRARPTSPALRERVAALAPVGRGRPSRARRRPLRARAVPLACHARASGSARWPRPCAERPISPRPRSTETSGEAAQPFAALNAAFFADGYVLDVAPGVALDAADRDRSSGVGRERGLVSHPQPGRRSATAAAPASSRPMPGEGRLLAQRRRRGCGSPPARRCAAPSLVEEAPDALHFGAVSTRRSRRHARLAGFVAAARRPPRAARGECPPGGRGRPLPSSTAPFCVAGSDEANIVTDGRSRRARRADPRTDQGRRGGSRPRRVSGPHRRARGRAEDRCAPAEPQPDHRPRARSSTPSPSSKSTPTTSNAATAPAVGDLDEAALFYLRARGIPAEEARRMLIEGFLREAVEEHRGPRDARRICCGRLGRRLGKLEE